MAEFDITAQANASLEISYELFDAKIDEMVSHVESAIARIEALTKNIKLTATLDYNGIAGNVNAALSGNQNISVGGAKTVATELNNVAASQEKVVSGFNEINDAGRSFNNIDTTDAVANIERIGDSSKKAAAESTKSFSEMGSGASKAAAEVSAVGKAIDERSKIQFKFDIGTNTDGVALFKTRLEELGVQKPSIDEISAAFQNFDGIIKSVNVSFDELENGAKSVTSAIITAVNSAGDTVTDRMRFSQNKSGNIEISSERSSVKVDYSKQAKDLEILTTASNKYYNAQQHIVSQLEKVNKVEQDYSAAANSRKKGSSDAYKNVIGLKNQYKSLSNELSKGETTLGSYNERVKNLDTQLLNSKKIIKDNGDAHKSLGDTLKGNAEKFTKWFSASQLIMRIFRELKQMVDDVIEVDTAMTELRKVTDETEATYSNFLTTATGKAKQLGATISDVVNATADAARLGLTLKEAEDLTEASVIYKNVGDRITDISQASESLVSTMKGFHLEAEDSLAIVDKLNAVGNTQPIDSTGIGEALQRSAAALYAASNDLDQSIGLIAAGNSVLQNPESVGKHICPSA